MGQWWNYWRSKGHATKNRVESYRSLDCSWLYDKRDHLLAEGEEACIHGYWLQLFSSYAVVTLTNNTGYRIPVVSTKCNYGGERHWFLCPVSTCNQRSKKLYLHATGLFLCRKCLNLAYSSQNHSRLDRIIDKKWDLIHKLGGDSHTLHKPKGMHLITFENMQKEIERLDILANQEIAERFGDIFCRVK